TCCHASRPFAASRRAGKMSVWSFSTTRSSSARRSRSGRGGGPGPPRASSRRPCVSLVHYVNFGEEATESFGGNLEDKIVAFRGPVKRDTFDRGFRLYLGSEKFQDFLSSGQSTVTCEHAEQNSS